MKTTAFVSIGLMLGVAARLQAAEPAAAAPAVYPAAIFVFEERGEGIKGIGAKVSDILFAKLAADPTLCLVDRQDLRKTLGEQEINLSGIVTPDQAVAVGRLTGAKLLVTGSVIEADRTLYLVAKIIGTETSRVLGESVQGQSRDEIAPLAETLAGKVAELIRKSGDQLVVKEIRVEDRIAALKKALGSARRPTVSVHIAEHHVGRVVFDPAAETELVLFLKECGFEVLDSSSRATADIRVEGEGFSEFAVRYGNLVSVKARVEIKAVDPVTEKVIAMDRQTSLVVDLAEELAGKKALQEAAAALAERLLLKLAAE